jgi:hypothetical protein
VQGTRQQLLARARLSEQEDRHVGRGHLVHLGQRGADRGALAHDLSEPLGLLGLFLEIDLLGGQPLP